MPSKPSLTILIAFAATLSIEAVHADELKSPTLVDTEQLSEGCEDLPPMQYDAETLNIPVDPDTGESLAENVFYQLIPAVFDDLVHHEIVRTTTRRLDEIDLNYGRQRAYWRDTEGRCWEQAEMALQARTWTLHTRSASAKITIGVRESELLHDAKCDLQKLPLKTSISVVRDWYTLDWDDLLPLMGAFSPAMGQLGELIGSYIDVEGGANSLEVQAALLEGLPAAYQAINDILTLEGLTILHWTEEWKTNETDWVTVRTDSCEIREVACEDFILEIPEGDVLTFDLESLMCEMTYEEYQAALEKPADLVADEPIEVPVEFIEPLEETFTPQCSPPPPPPFPLPPGFPNHLELQWRASQCGP